MTDLSGAPGVNPEIPNAARMYDYYLGGAHNFAADRELADMARTVLPSVDMVARLNRSFLRRVVRYMVDEGITQFLDLGSGIPTVGNVHEIAPDARVVYVDCEPIAVTHSELILASTPNATIIRADIRNPGSIVDHPRARELLDLDQPLGLLMVGVLLFISDDDEPARLAATYRDICAPGSYLAISSISTDEADEQTRAQVDKLVRVYEQANDQIYVRTRSAITSWFDGTDLVDPGVTLLADWRPDDGTSAVDTPARTLGYGGVGRIR
jgi:hypothetical protein